MASGLLLKSAFWDSSRDLLPGNGGHAKLGSRVRAHAMYCRNKLHKRAPVVGASVVPSSMLLHLV